MQKYKIGKKLLVLGDWEKMGHAFPIGTIVDVIRFSQEDNAYDVCCKANGDIFWVHEKDLETLNKNTKEMKAMKSAVLTVAKKLASANNTVTTLEIKVELRRDYPYYFWDQSTVSTFMDQLAGDGIFDYTDNGTYRTYSVVGKAVNKPLTKTITTSTTKRSRTRGSFKTTTLNRTLALSMVSTGFESVVLSNGKTVTASDIKGQKKSPLGYLTPKVSRIVSITISGKTYQVK